MTDIVTEREGVVATITLNRPESRNAMTFEMLEGLVDVLEDLAHDESIHVVVLRGAGDHFCVGADLAMLAGRSGRDGSPPSAARVARLYRSPVLLHEMPQVTIAAVRGACVGAGFGLAAACDMRICASDALFRTAFARIGVAGDMSGAWTLPAIVGSAHATSLYLLNDRVEAERAAEIGLVSHVFAADEFEEQLTDIVGRLAASAPLALRTMKRNFLDARRLSLGEYEELETERHHRLVRTDDVREAAAAFLEKREPRFTGR